MDIMADVERDFAFVTVVMIMVVVVVHVVDESVVMVFALSYSEEIYVKFAVVR